MRTTSLAALVSIVGCSSSPTDVTLDVRWSATLAPVSRRVLGHNAVWSRGGLGLWDDAAHAIQPDVAALVTALRPGVLRFPGGTRAMTYHFDEAIGPYDQRRPQCDTFTGKLDATTWGPDEALRFAESLAAEVTLVTPWYDGTPERAAALVAYANADPSSTVVIGVDANGRDWGTAGAWAARRVANGHAAPYHVPFLEVGNEQYLTLRPGTNVCGTDHGYTQAERVERGVYIPSTARDVADQIAKTARLAKRVDPQLRVGAPALSDPRIVDPATAISEVDTQAGTGDAWNPTLVAVAGADFDFFVVHTYSFTGDPLRVRLADQLRATVASLRTLPGDHGVAVTEFGTLFDADTQLGALASADFVRVAIEDGLVMNLRHLLIEDKPSGLFATSAAILDHDHHRTPGYHAMALLANALGDTAVPWQSSDPQIVAIATRDTTTGAIAIALVDRRLVHTPTVVRVALPPGAWRGQISTLAAPDLVGASELQAIDFAGRGDVALALPADGLVVAHLAPAP